MYIQRERESLRQRERDNLNPNGNHVFQTSIKRAFSDGHEIYDVILEAGPAWRNQHAMIFHDLKRTPSFFSAFRF